MNAPAKEYDGIHKYIRITDIDEQTSAYKQDDVVSPDAELEEKYKVKENDILFARTGASTGKSYLYDINDGVLYYAGFLIRGNVKIDNNAKFVFLQTKTSNYKNWVGIMSARSGQPGINSQEYSSYRFRIPSKAEQNKIAQVFSLIDDRIQTQIGAIEKLKSLISSLNDKLQFQFCNEVNLSFSEIGNDYSGLSGKSANDFGRGKPYIPYTNIYANTFVDDSQFDLVEINEGEHQCRVLNGDVLFTLSSEVPEEVCVGSVYLGNEKELYLNSFCFGVHINSNKIHSPYLAYFVKSSIFRHTVYPLAQGSTRFNLQKSDFLKRKFSFPNIEHQIKIANVLMAIDSKLKIEQKLLEQYKLQKQYLLSQMFI